jgi:hypothetical protein
MEGKRETWSGGGGARIRGPVERMETTNLGRYEVGRYPLECARGLGGEKPWGLRGRDLRWNVQQWGEGLVESTCRGKTGHQVERWGYHPTVKNSNPELFLSKRIAWTKMKTRLRERMSSDRPKLKFSSVRPEAIADAMVCLQIGTLHGCPLEAQQAAERVRCRYLQPING